jgi:LuxR family maltose regulon positive regulatory protein
MLQLAGDGPRGALFALPAVRELAAAPWGAELDAHALATLRAWAAAPAAPGVATRTRTAPGGPALDDVLSTREAEVLALMARGMSNKLIARELDLSPHTVKRHVAHVLDKLALSSRGEAAAWYHARAR